MRRVLFDFRGVRIYSYPVLLYAGLVCGFYVMYAVAPSLGLRRDQAAVATLLLFAPAILGARLWFVFDHWALYRGQLSRVWRYSEGGMSLYGGLICALLLSPALLGPLGLGFAAFWDANTLTLLVGMMFARVGCLLNGCCSGQRSEGPFALSLPDSTGRSERRSPVQLIEMTFAAILLGGSGLLLEVGAPRGTIFVFGLTGYASVRWALDPLRQSSAPHLTTHRVALAVFLASSMTIFAAGWLVTAP